MALKHADSTVNYLEERTQDSFRGQNNKETIFCIGQTQKVPEKFKLQKL